MVIQKHCEIMRAQELCAECCWLLRPMHRPARPSDSGDVQATQRQCSHQPPRACSWESLQHSLRVWRLLEAMLIGITAPLHAVHFHARVWRALDGPALLLCVTGALPLGM